MSTKKQCQKTLNNGKKCTKPAKIDGYCTVHATKMKQIESDSDSDDHKKKHPKTPIQQRKTQKQETKNYSSDSEKDTQKETQKKYEKPKVEQKTPTRNEQIKSRNDEIISRNSKIEKTETKPTSKIQIQYNNKELNLIILKGTKKVLSKENGDTRFLPVEFKAIEKAGYSLFYDSESSSESESESSSSSEEEFDFSDSELNISDQSDESNSIQSEDVSEYYTDTCSDDDSDY